MRVRAPRALARWTLAFGLLFGLLGLFGLAAAGAMGAGDRDLAPSELAQCLGERSLPRVARVVDPTGQVVYARVLASRDGRPTRFSALASGATPLGEVMKLAALPVGSSAAGEFAISEPELPRRLCSPVDLPRSALDAEQQVIVAAGLNYAAHAEEAGGGEVFLFPKPAPPTGAYAVVHPPADVTLLDYEIELAFVLLDELELSALPEVSALLSRLAFFVANDVSDRAPIIEYKALSGPGTGFVDGKGQPSFLPAGPWLVRGTELFSALEKCGADGLGLALWVDEGDGLRPRQSATTARMILEPRALLVRIGEALQDSGRYSPMPLRSDGEEHFYPLAVDDARPRLPAGSIVLTGTPEGVALHAPSPLGVALRGAVRLRSPFEQFLFEERERAALDVPGGYLRTGDRVVARIDGLGTQEFRIGAAGGAPEAAGCAHGSAPLAP